MSSSRSFTSGHTSPSPRERDRSPIPCNEHVDRANPRRSDLAAQRHAVPKPSAPKLVEEALLSCEFRPLVGPQHSASAQLRVAPPQTAQALRVNPSPSCIRRPSPSHQQHQQQMFKQHQPQQMFQQQRPPSPAPQWPQRAPSPAQQYQQRAPSPALEHKSGTLCNYELLQRLLERVGDNNRVRCSRPNCPTDHDSRHIFQRVKTIEAMPTHDKDHTIGKLCFLTRCAKQTTGGKCPVSGCFEFHYQNREEFDRAQNAWNATYHKLFTDTSVSEHELACSKMLFASRDGCDGKCGASHNAEFILEQRELVWANIAAGYSCIE